MTRANKRKKENEYEKLDELLYESHGTDDCHFYR